MDRELEMIGLSAAILVVVLAILVLAILHRRRLNQVSDQLAEGAVDNGETLKGVVKFENDATRRHVSGAVDAIAHNTEMTKLRITNFVDQHTNDTNEIRGQLTSLKDRLQWLIKVLDVIADRIRSIPAQVGEWLARNKDQPKP